MQALHAMATTAEEEKQIRNSTGNKDRKGNKSGGGRVN
jgi:hypothetical protein